jgi:Heavy metal associated domain 2
MGFYLHHVPGRLRIQTSELQHSRFALSACGALATVDGVDDARFNPMTGSLLVLYDHRRLKAASLWDALCGCGVVSGRRPIDDDGGVTRIARGGVAPAPGHSELLAAVAGIAAERVLERVAVALIRSLI